MGQISKEYICKYCKNSFYMTRGAFSCHMAYCEKNPNSQKYKELAREKRISYIDKVKEEYQKNKSEKILVCKNCGNKYVLELTDDELKSKNYSQFCTNSCSKSYAGKQINNEFKQAKCIDCGCNIIIKNKSSTKSCRCEHCKYLHKNPIKKCIVCGKEFRKNKAKCCSKECFQYYISNKKKYLSKSTMDRFVEIGRKSAEIQKETRRSKNEIYFFELCKTHFNNVLHNERIFNGWDADVIIEDFKIAILWNGPWHYKQICKNHSVKQVQNRDKIKLNEIKKMGYIPYIIKDEGSENKEFVEEQFNIFLNFIKNI